MCVCICLCVVYIHLKHTSMQGSVTYQLPNDGVTWSSVFKQLENNRERLGIINYSVSQTTLEQVSCSIPHAVIHLYPHSDSLMGVKLSHNMM